MRRFTDEISQELSNILSFWQEKALDADLGGFVGKMGIEGGVITNAPKGAVLNARILWAFSAAFNFTQQPEYLALASRAYNYLYDFFKDTQHGGVFWSVDAKGKPLNRRKQIYAQAFAIYGISEYYKATKLQQALDWAIELFELIEQYSFDQQDNGYFEAFADNWTALADLRLSEKDRNEPKTMNTHLHIVEAYGNLYQVWNSKRLGLQIENLLCIFKDKIIDASTNHLQLFFDSQWHSQSKNISYGHDIEASWLLLEVAEILGIEHLIKTFRNLSMLITNAATEGLQEDGSFVHEYNPITNHYDTHREWWVEAEGMVGYLNAYKLTHDSTYLAKVQALWLFTKKYLIDKVNKEWFWGVLQDYSIMKSEDKIGFWKCPYHNVRACIEILKRLETPPSITTDEKSFKEL